MILILFLYSISKASVLHVISSGKYVLVTLIMLSLSNVKIEWECSKSSLAIEMIFLILRDLRILILSYSVFYTIEIEICLSIL